MKIKRIFAVLLTVMMVTSCFYFTANAESEDILTKKAVIELESTENTCDEIELSEDDESVLAAVVVPETNRDFNDNVIYIDTTGDDANDGLSPENAIKTLKSIFSLNLFVNYSLLMIEFKKKFFYKMETENVSQILLKISTHCG